MGKVLKGVAKVAGPVVGLATGNPALGAAISGAGSLLGGSGEVKSNVSSGSGVQTVRTINQPLFPDFMKDDIHDLAARASEFSLRPYEPYPTEDRIEGFTPDQLAAFAGIRDLQDAYMPYYDEAAGLTREVADRARQGFLSPEEISQYMSPYQQSVTDIAKREALRDFDMELNRIGDFAAKSGAFGGSRHGILESEAYRDVNQRLDDLQVQGSQSAYDRALQTALQTGPREAQMLGQAGTQLANLGGAAQGAQLQNLQALLGIGGQQQTLGQSLRDFDYSQFVEQRDYPATQMAQQASILYPLFGQQGSETGRSERFRPGLSPATAALGLGSLVAGGFGGGGGGGLGGIGNFLGRLGGGSGILGGLGAMSLGASNPFTTPSQSYSMGSQGIYGPYKEGGLVGREKKHGNTLKKYAQGGKVDRTKKHKNTLKKYADGGQVTGFQRDISKYVTEPFANLLQELGARQVAGMMRSRNRVASLKDYFTKPTGVAEEAAFQRDLQEAQFGLETGRTGFPRSLVQTMQAIRPAAKELTRLESEATPEKQVVDKLTKELDSGREANELAPIFESKKEEKVDPIEQALAAVQSSRPQPQAQRQQHPLLGNIPLPSINMAAQILSQGAGRQPLEALGLGLGAYAESVQAQNESEIKAKQAEFDNMLAKLNASTNRMNAEANTSKTQMMEKLFPLSVEEKKAEVEKIQAEAKIKAMQAANPGLSESIAEIVKIGVTTETPMPDIAKQVQQLVGSYNTSQGGAADLVFNPETGQVKPNVQ